MVVGCPPFDYTITIIILISVFVVSICFFILILILCPTVTSTICFPRKQFLINPHPQRKYNYTRNILKEYNYRQEKKRGRTESSKRFI